MSLSVKIRLLDVSSHFQMGDDETDERKFEILAEMLDALFDRSKCYSAKEYLSIISGDGEGNPDDTVVRDELVQGIKRFLKVNDRYLALASLLMKNQAFFDALRRPSKADPFPLVSLPRTKHRKPYIPIPSSETHLEDTGDDEADVDAFSISLSHQWPFAGWAQIEHPVGLLETRARGALNTKPHVVGFDLVTFDAFNPRLYKTARDFVNVFRDSFSPREFTTIESCRGKPDEGYLREFYIQWAVKEAYTKALGVGLGFDFASFEVCWDSPIKSLWDVASAVIREQEYKVLRGRIVPVGVSEDGLNEKSHQRWVFAFVPLQAQASDEKPAGAGCACVGPFSEFAGTEAVQWDVEWIELSSLLP